MMRPTEQIYRELQEAYTFLNSNLYDDELPNCLITMQRRARSYGYFCRKRFVNVDGEESDEIALNPIYFASRSEAGVLSTLAHEMAHLFQYHFGNPGRRGYHNREWARKMIEVGLYPSNTGEPGGKEIGYQMTHYIIQGGPFDIVSGELLATGFRLSWLDNSGPLLNLVPPTTSPIKGNSDGSNRWKYTCTECQLNAWAKPYVSLLCGQCRVLMPQA